MVDRRIPVLRPFAARQRHGAPSPTPPSAPEPVEPTRGSSVVDSAVYVAGERVVSARTLPETYASLSASRDGMAWIGLYRPQESEIASLAAEFDLHPLVVEDAVSAHQRPKLERYGDTLFVVLRSARYRDAEEEVEFGELHLFLGHDFVVTLRHSEAPDLVSVRRRLEADPELLARGPEAVLYAVLDAVVDGYAPVVAGLANDIDEIETQTFGGDPSVSRRIYELSREVIEFQRAAAPLQGMVSSLSAGFDKYGIDTELQRYLRDVLDHLVQVTERVDGFRVLLRDMLTVNATLVGQRQNEETVALNLASHAQAEEVKKISAWAAILFAPTLVGTVYGMNFTHMPELDWVYGYPMALAMMALVSVVLYVVFKRRDWI